MLPATAPVVGKAKQVLIDALAWQAIRVFSKPAVVPTANHKKDSLTSIKGQASSHSLAESKQMKGNSILTGTMTMMASMSIRNDQHSFAVVSQDKKSKLWPKARMVLIKNSQANSGSLGRLKHLDTNPFMPKRKFHNELILSTQRSRQAGNQLLANPGAEVTNAG